MAELQYAELSERAKENLVNVGKANASIEKMMEEIGDVPSRAPDEDGNTEILDGVTFIHHFVSAPGDYDSIRWHYVDCGEGSPIVFLHGMPDSWYLWYHQMAALSVNYRCIAVDLKGYGQSEKREGNYRHEGASEQLYNMLKSIGVDKFFLATHDRGTVQGDFLVANHPK